MLIVFNGDMLKLTCITRLVVIRFDTQKVRERQFPNAELTTGPSTIVSLSFALRLARRLAPGQYAVMPL